MIIELRTRDKDQNAHSLSKKAEFYERLEETQVNQAKIKDGFSQGDVRQSVTLQVA